MRGISEFRNDIETESEERPRIYCETFQLKRNSVTTLEDSINHSETSNPFEFAASAIWNESWCFHTGYLLFVIEPKVKLKLQKIIQTNCHL